MNTNSGAANPPKPPSIADLPHDGRGVPLPIHVPRLPGKAPRITDVDSTRLLILSVERRCTICGWSIGQSERCWYVTLENSLREIGSTGWTLWDPSPEGTAHEECLLYAAVVCPWLATPNYQRRTDQRGAGRSLIEPKGTVRPPVLLAGAPDVVVVFDAREGEPYSVLLGGGEPEVVRYTYGAELIPRLVETLAGRARVPDAADLDLVKLLTQEDGPALKQRFTQDTVVAAARQGLPFSPPAGRNDLCMCGSGRKLKRCCQTRYEQERDRRHP